jgi:hypothetical protein
MGSICVGILTVFAEVLAVLAGDFVETATFFLLLPLLCCASPFAPF